MTSAKPKTSARTRGSAAPPPRPFRRRSRSPVCTIPVPSGERKKGGLRAPGTDSAPPLRRTLWTSAPGDPASPCTATSAADLYRRSRGCPVTARLEERLHSDAVRGFNPICRCQAAAPIISCDSLSAVRACSTVDSRFDPMQIRAVKLNRLTPLVRIGTFPDSEAWVRVKRDVADAVAAVRWPVGSEKFVINPTREGNGVKPIKESFLTRLRALGWRTEHLIPGLEFEAPDATRLPYEIVASPSPVDRLIRRLRRSRPGEFDAVLYLDEASYPPFAVEWETGNISSSHRALNKMALGMMRRLLSGGLLVLPSRAMYWYLTDRVGNYQELEPYFGLWRSISVADGVLAVVEVEHDAEDTTVALISKGTDGRALI